VSKGTNKGPSTDPPSGPAVDTGATPTLAENRHRKPSRTALENLLSLFLLSSFSGIASGMKGSGKTKTFAKKAKFESVEGKKPPMGMLAKEENAQLSTPWKKKTKANRKINTKMVKLTATILGNLSLPKKYNGIEGESTPFKYYFQRTSVAKFIIQFHSTT
jgi:hypothetical protein